MSANPRAETTGRMSGTGSGGTAISARGLGTAALEQERAELRRRLRRDLPEIDCKYFYDDLGSRLFEGITRLPEYYQTRTEEALLARVAERLAELRGARELLELGSGSGRKIRLLIDALQRRGGIDSCVLLDVNERFLRAAVESLARDYPDLEIRGVIGDFREDLASVGDGVNRLVLLLAGTVGNLYPSQLADFLRGLPALVGPRGAFLVGLDLVKEQRRLEAAYNDSAGLTSKFNANILRVLNRRFETGFELDAFDHVAFWDAENEWIEMRLRATRATGASLGGGEMLRLAAGDEIRTEISRKFTRRSFVAALEGSGLELAEWFTDPEELFASAVVRPVSRGGS